MQKATMKRENGNINIDGNIIPFRDRWVARDANGKYLGHDQYRHDLKDRLRDHYDVEIIGD